MIPSIFRHIILIGGLILTSFGSTLWACSHGGASVEIQHEINCSAEKDSHPCADHPSKANDSSECPCTQSCICLCCAKGSGFQNDIADISLEAPYVVQLIVGYPNFFDQSHPRAIWNPPQS